jgi:hypothetical protein
VYAARRLRWYFQAHPVKVLTEQPIQQVLRKPEVLGRLAKWAIELGEHTIEYCPRTSVKSQILADSLAELPEGETTEVNPSGKGGETPEQKVEDVHRRVSR